MFGIVWITGFSGRKNSKFGRDGFAEYDRAGFLEQGYQGRVLFRLAALMQYGTVFSRVVSCINDVLDTDR